MQLEEMVKKLEELGYVCIPKKEYDKLKEDLKEAQNEIQHLYEDMAGADL